MRDELNEQDFLDRAIVELARTHKNADRMGDPVWCEIIAKDVGNLAQALLDERRKVLRVESTAEQFEKIETFDVDLIEKLVPIFADATRHDIDPRPGVRAILSELASMPCELPTADAIAQAWNIEPSPLPPKVNVLLLVQSRVAPILAAKDTEIARLVQVVAAMQAAMDRHKSDAEDILRREAELHVVLKNYALPTNPKAFAVQYEERIADLESRAPVNSCTDAERQQYEQTIRLQVEKIMDLEKRLADLSAPTVRDMSYDDMVRAFGQEGVGHIVELALDKTGRKETAEALQRVRDRVGVPLILGNVQRDIVFEFIDKELARLGQ